MINKTCHIGIGGCGNKLVNTLMEINSSVNGIFINTNINEMKKLSKFDVDLGNYLYINGDGTGRDPQRAEELLNANKQKIGEFFKSKVGNFTTYVLYASCDGGTGSGSIKPISTAIKRINEVMGYDVSINLVCVCPTFNNRKINLKNTLWTRQKIKTLLNDGVIDSYRLIDNNKMDNYTEKEFNIKVMKSIYNAYSINHDELDSTDASIINNTHGYGVILELPKEFSGNTRDAINYAIEESYFVLPKNLGSCKSIGISFVEGEFDTKEALDCFTVKEFDKEDYNPFKNIIVLGGCNEPTWIFNKYAEEYNKIDVEEDYNEDEEINVDFNTFNTRKNEIKPKSKISTEKDLRDLYNDLW